jgi:channel protein (hemolysin III family)
VDTAKDIVEVIGLPGFREPVASFTHLLGAAVALAAAPSLWMRARRHGASTWSIHLFWLSCVTLLSISGTYHMFSPHTTAREVMMRLDVAAIFFFIASTCTPLYFLLFKGVARWSMLIAVWIVAITGITLRMIFFQETQSWFGLAIFLSMGWMGAGASIVIWRRYGFTYLRQLVFGGFAYSIGALGLGLGKPTLIPGVIEAHEVWHIWVLVGIACHWAFIWNVAGGPPTLHHDWAETEPVHWEEDEEAADQPPERSSRQPSM